MLARTLRHAAFALTLLTPALAGAQKAAPAPTEDQKSSALSKAQEGLKLFGEDRWDEALRAFNEAYAHSPVPTIRVYIARCLRKKGQMFEARKVYQEIIAAPLPPEAPPQFVAAHDDAVKELEVIRQKTPTMQVQVLGAPAGAQVLMNGAPLGNEAKEVDPGEYTVEVRSGTKVLHTRTVKLAEGDKDPVKIDLRPPPTLPPQGGVPWFLPGAITGGAGVLILAVGAITGGLSVAKANDVKAQCPAWHTMPCDTSLKNEGDTAGLLGNVSTATLVIGGAAVVVGGALLGIRRPRAPRPPQTGVTGVGLGLGQIAVEGRF
jgi:hypothetical protein